MTSLVACLSSGKGTWAHISKLIEEQEWDSIFLITNDFGVQNFKPEKAVNYILIDSNKFLSEIAKDIKSQLEGKIKDLEVAVNLISGNGKEHMATISALTKLGLGIRLIALTPDGIKEV
jgi:hypothetical protein